MKNLKLYSTKEVAEIIGYSHEHTLRLIHLGRLNVVEKGYGRNGRYKLNEENIKDFIKSLGV